MPLPSSGIISGSQIGVYVFDRSPTAIFSLSASLASPGNSTKAYSTALGPIWRGEGDGDVKNPQYDEIAPWSYATWYDYYKGQAVSVGASTWDDPNDACNDDTEGLATSTDWPYWGASDGIIAFTSMVYGDAEGTIPLDDAGNYRRCNTLDNDVGTAYYGIFAKGKYTDPQRCP